MTRLALKILCTIALALAMVAHAFAQGVSVTRAPQSVVMHDGTTGTVLKGPDGKALTYPNVDACEVAAGTMFAATPADTVELRYRCVQANVLTFKRNCEGIPKPALETFVIIDPNGAKYVGGYCAPGETCAHESQDQLPWVRILPDGTEYKLQDVGGLDFQNESTTLELRLENVNQYPRCWEWQWIPQGEPVALRSGEDADGDGHGDGPVFASTPTDWFKPPLDPGAEGGNGLTGEPWWPSNGGSGVKP